MEIKRLIRQFSYKIEPKPEGGFIARSSDPSVPPIEAPTREELETRIQANFAAALGLAFPGLNIPVDQRNVKFEVHIDRKPEGGFAVHSQEVGTSTMNPATHEKIDHFAEELLGFVDKNFPLLSQALAAQATSKDIKFFATAGTSATVTQGSQMTPVQPDLAQSMLPAPTFQKMFAQPGGAQTIDGSTGDLTRASLASTPITPEASSTKTFFRLLLFAVAIAGMLYFVFYRR
jgi:hypothetical protein